MTLFIFASSMIIVAFLTDTLMYFNEFATATIMVNLIPIALIPIFLIMAIKGKIRIKSSYAIIVYITIAIIFTVILLNYFGIEQKNYQLFRILISSPLLILSVTLISGYKHTIITGIALTIIVSISLILTHKKEFYELYIYASFLLTATTLAMTKFVKSLEKTMEMIYEQEEIITSQNKRLEKANTEKDSLFSIIAHDLRGPVGLTKEMLDYLDEDDISSKEKEELIGLIKNSITNSYNLLNNLFLWARSNRNEIRFNPGKYSIQETVTSTTNYFELAAKKKNINIKQEISSNCVAYFDFDMITTVLRNLVSNAIKFTNTYGTVLISSKKEKDYVVVSVHDNGIGMDERKIEKLFSKENINISLGTDNEKGSGLGLRICDNFVIINKGKIKVESKVGKGTTFSFTLPCDKNN
jgi:signal transduction histidine kinase